MSPAASVCGVYISHPKSHYFSVGRLCADQVSNWGCVLNKYCEQRHDLPVHSIGVFGVSILLSAFPWL